MIGATFSFPIKGYSRSTTNIADSVPLDQGPISRPKATQVEHSGPKSTAFDGSSSTPQTRAA